MKNGNCSICENETSELWLLNLAQVDSLSMIEGKNIRQDVCEKCVSKLNQAVTLLANGNETTMEKAFEKVGVSKDRENLVEKDRPKKTKSFQSNTRVDMQNDFLSNLVSKRALVSVEPMDGIGWRGVIKSFDNFSILLVDEQKETSELIFKHAIKSIKSLSE